MSDLRGCLVYKVVVNVRRYHLIPLVDPSYLDAAKPMILPGLVGTGVDRVAHPANVGTEVDQALTNRYTRGSTASLR